MHSEIEAKFLSVKHDEARACLTEIGAHREQPARLMRRAMFDYPDKRFRKNAVLKPHLRVRDEGDKITVTYKEKNGTNYRNEIETTAGSFDTMVEILRKTGLEVFSLQESRRETWRYKDVEVVLDEWPWLDPYIEIEGPSENAIRKTAKALGFEWSQACFGSVDTAYRKQYPGMDQEDSIGNVAEVRFNLPLPNYLKDRQ